jgi:serine protease Do
MMSSAMNPIVSPGITSEGLYDVGELLRRLTVQVLGPAGSYGAGVIWSGNGLILTTAHVVSGSHRVQVFDGRCWDAELVRRDRERDLAMLRIPVRGIESANVRDSRTLRPGEVVIAAGHPMGEAGAISYGIVHAVPAGKLVEADIRLAPGNSGGPLADVTGRVVGINCMVVNRMGIAVSSACVAEFLQGNRETGWGNG